MTKAARATENVVLFLFLGLVSLPSEENPELTFRALWVVRGSMTSPAEIDRSLRFAKENGFNHLFVQVRGRGDAFYNSQVVPKARPIRESNFDPLDYAVRKGHELGLSIHAWLNVYLIWSSEWLPEIDTHILNRYPEWVDRSFFGETTSHVGKELNNYQTGNEQFLSPAHPEVVNRLVNIFREVIANYDIDGLHLDYVRYSDADFGYTGAARRDFQKEYRVDPVELVKETGPDSNPVSPGRRQFLLRRWVQYRRDRVTALLRKCNALILDLDPQCILSVAVKPGPNEARDRYYQEWDRWLAEGLVDYVVPMNYTPDLRLFARNIDEIYESIPTKYWPGIVMGIAVYNQDALDARDKVRYAKVTGFSGISIFSYDAHKNDPDFFRPIVDEINR
ncbi:MAG: glycoside hydrolase family 10 protein [Fidelibacterota bacterium]